MTTSGYCMLLAEGCITRLRASLQGHNHTSVKLYEQFKSNNPDCYCIDWEKQTCFYSHSPKLIVVDFSYDKSILPQISVLTSKHSEIRSYCLRPCSNGCSDCYLNYSVFIILNLTALRSFNLNIWEQIKKTSV